MWLQPSVHAGTIRLATVWLQPSVHAGTTRLATVWLQPSVHAGTIRLAVVWLKSHNSQTYGTGIYQLRCTAYKVASDDGLI